MPLTYKEIERILQDLHFVLIRQKWSHQQWNKGKVRATIPFHKTYPPKTAKSILYQISLAEGISYQELIKNYQIKL